MNSSDIYLQLIDNLDEDDKALVATLATWMSIPMARRSPEIEKTLLSLINARLRDQQHPTAVKMLFHLVRERLRQNRRSQRAFNV